MGVLTSLIIPMPTEQEMDAALIEMGFAWRCSSCGEVSAWTKEDEEFAQKETIENFGEFNHENYAKVCTDCYNKIMKFNNHPGF